MLKPLVRHLLILLMLCGMALPQTTDRVWASEAAKRQYQTADRACRSLKKNPAKQKYRDSWLKCIKGFEQIFLKRPKDPWAAAAMYRTAGLYLDLYKQSFNHRDQQEGVDLLQRIIKRYPKSAYRNRSETLLKTIQPAETAGTKKTAPMKSSSGNASVSKRPAVTLPHKEGLKRKSRNGSTTTAVPPETLGVSAPPVGPIVEMPTLSDPPPETKPDTHVTNVRHWSNPSYTRVVIDIDNDRPFTHALLKQDPNLKKPPRLFVDIDGARLGKEIPKLTYINDHLLIQARAGQHDAHTVRVVVDIKSFGSYKIFSLRDPFRVVVDVWADKKTTAAASSPQKTAVSKPEIPPVKPNGKIPPSAIAKQLALGVQTIVIDAGHGGKDPGAPGYVKGVHEKQIVLKLARRLKTVLEKRLGCSVILTRNSDTYLTLEERTAIANTRNADLFISLHCNAAKNKNLYGVETYLLNLATDDEAINVAARENATSKKNISDLQSILNDLMKNAKINESGRLSRHVQTAICRGLAAKYKRIRNLGVKQAPFYVLMGATMPSVLIETSFISNKRECRRLMDATYRSHLCNSIADGIERYIVETGSARL